MKAFKNKKQELRLWGALLWAGFWLWSFAPLVAQQEAQFTQYQFNTLVFNPGYAGSKDHLSMVALYRDQWLGWGGGDAGLTTNDGRPVTMTFSVHTPIQKRVGIGLNIVRDKIGVHTSTGVDLVYAYRIKFGEGTLSLGLQGGIMNWKTDWSTLNFRDPRATDLAFADLTPSLFLPRFGGGVYFYTDRFYVGLSIPNMVSFDLRKKDPDQPSEFQKIASTYPHFYVALGSAFPINGDDLVFKPSVLMKSVGLFGEFFTQSTSVKTVGAPTALELDLSLMFFRKIWVGGSFRTAFEAFAGGDKVADSSHSSVNARLALYLPKGLHVGFAYDYPLNGLANYVTGSFELMVGYEFAFLYDKMQSPRYFD
ncbi:MAG: type IX secretion system membrane protein PorP/SprF [Bacteroidetes bacterium]|nr:MAG: type IX secretion system membrane protein PorP/SprF [Bacteroidota bacterium]